MRHALAAQRLALAAGALVACALWGFHVVMVLPGEPHPLTVLLLGIVMTQLCVVDGALLERPIPTLVRWVVLITWPFTVPGRLVWHHHGTERVYAILYLISLPALYVLGAAVGWAIRAFSGQPVPIG